MHHIVSLYAHIIKINNQFFIKKHVHLFVSPDLVYASLVYTIQIINQMFIDKYVPLSLLKVYVYALCHVLGCIYEQNNQNIVHKGLCIALYQ